jgi:uncharacterized Zn finger protein
MSLKTSDTQPEISPVNLQGSCTHSRMISDSVTEVEHESGQVRCQECGQIVPDPHLKQKGKGV